MTLEELLQEHEVEVAPSGHRHTRPGWVNFDCPFCGNGTQKFHLGFNTKGGYCYCWKCGYHTLRETLVHLIGLSRQAATKLVRQLDIEEFPRFESKRVSGKLRLPDPVESLSSPHKHYLQHRGFDPYELERVWGLLGTGPIPFQLAWRIIIPIYYRGRIVSWTSRTIGNRGQRYVTAKRDDEAVHHKDVLYGMDLCSNSVIVHEGPADVWKTGPGSVALLGAYATPSQMHFLSQFSHRIICLDSDTESQRNAEKIANDLSACPGSTEVAVLESGKDAAEADEKEIQELRRRIL